MKQLPGRSPRSWKQILITGLFTAVATILILALLPFVFLFILLIAATLLPLLHRVSKDLRVEYEPRHRIVDVTPWHQTIRTNWRAPAARPSETDWVSVAEQDPDHR